MAGMPSLGGPPPTIFWGGILCVVKSKAVRPRLNRRSDTGKKSFGMSLTSPFPPPGLLPIEHQPAGGVLLVDALLDLRGEIRSDPLPPLLRKLLRPQLRPHGEQRRILESHVKTVQGMQKVVYFEQPLGVIQLRISVIPLAVGKKDIRDIGHVIDADVPVVRVPAGIPHAPVLWPVI